MSKKQYSKISTDHDSHGQSSEVQIMHDPANDEHKEINSNEKGQRHEDNIGLDDVNKADVNKADANNAANHKHQHNDSLQIDDQHQSDETKQEKPDPAYTNCWCDCWNCCCIQKRVHRGNGDKTWDEDNFNGNEQDKNRFAVGLNEDIWSLGYVIARHRRELPCSYISLLCCIYFVQVMVILGMFWSYTVYLTRNVEKKYEIIGECDIGDIGNYTTTEIFCGDVNVIEGAAQTQTWHNVQENYNSNNLFESAINAIIQTKGDVVVFPFAAVFSFISLSCYIAYSMVNPSIMFIIGHEYNQNKLPLRCDKLCKCCLPDGTKENMKHCCTDFCVAFMCRCKCSSMSCLLYTMAWLNTILSLAAFGLGFWILGTYPALFGIESPVDIILTPVGLVFVLEIDNWVSDVAKQFYPESEMTELYQFKASHFKDKTFEERGQGIWSWVLTMLMVVALIMFIFLSNHVYHDLHEGASEVVGVAAITGFTLIFLMLILSILFGVILILTLYCRKGCGLAMPFEKDKWDEEDSIDTVSLQVQSSLEMAEINDS